MHGGPNTHDEETNIIDYLKNEIVNMPPPNEFLELKKFSVPKSMRECQERLKENFPRFRGNYLALFLMFVVFFIILNHYAVLIGLVWIVYLFMKKRGTSFNIGEFRVTPQHMFAAAIGITALFLVLGRMICAALVVFSVFTLCTLAHLSLYTVQHDEGV